MDYGRLISKAFFITLRRRFLWPLGILAGLSGGVSAPNQGSFGDGAEEWVSTHLALVLALGALLVLLAIALLVISVMARGGLISSVIGIEKEEPVSFGKGFRAGYAVFWRLVAIGLLFALVVLTPLIVLIAMVAGLIITKHYWAAAGTGIPFFLIWLAITIYAGVVAVFAARFVVDRGAGAFESIGRAHGLIMRCKGETTLVWLLSVALGIGTGTAYLLVFLLFFLPLIFITPSLYHSSGLATAVIFGAIFGLIALAVILLITGLLTVFQSAYWTLAYLELAKKEAPANVPLLQEPQMGTSAG